MKSLGNIIWFIFVGFISFLVWTFFGLLLYITIIGIPLGRQCFKIAELIVFPFNRNVETNFNAHPIANIIWLILLGWEIAIGYVVASFILCITIIGIPFAKQCFKIVLLALMPFGAEVR